MPLFSSLQLLTASFLFFFILSSNPPRPASKPPQLPTCPHPPAPTDRKYQAAVFSKFVYFGHPFLKFSPVILIQVILFPIHWGLMCRVFTSYSYSFSVSLPRPALTPQPPQLPMCPHPPAPTAENTRPLLFFGSLL